jgi:hypothetical protein
MSFNLSARLSSLERIALSSLSLKANLYSPIFTGSLNVSDVNGNSISYLASTGIVFNNETVINSSLTINDATNRTPVATINSSGIIFNSPMTITSTLSAPMSIQAKNMLTTVLML